MIVAELSQIDASHKINIISSQWTKLLFFQFCCLIFHFVLFPLLSVAYIVTVASLCTTSKPVVSFAIPSSICKRLFIIYLWNSLIMAVYSLIFIGSVALVFVGYGLEPVYGFAVMDMGCDLLKTNNPTAAWLIFFSFRVVVALINGGCWLWFYCRLG